LKVICNYCNEEAVLVQGSQLFSHIPKLKNKLFWKCYPCAAHVGCPEGSRKPHGSLAKSELRKLRMKCHAKLDPLWRNTSDSRSDIYAILAINMGLTKEVCHIGMFNESTCDHAMMVIDQMSMERSRNVC